VYGNIALGRSQQDHATDFGKPERRLHIQSGEYGFDRNTLRLKFLDQIAQHRVYFAEPLGKVLGTLARGAQGAEAEHPAAASITFDHAITGSSCGGGINAKDPEERAIRSK
jgi:hypothetical protein